MLTGPGRDIIVDGFKSLVANRPGMNTLCSDLHAHRARPRYHCGRLQEPGCQPARHEHAGGLGSHRILWGQLRGGPLAQIGVEDFF
eukprot:1138432-Pelagomonas_calceolata.AAC.1